MRILRHFPQIAGLVVFPLAMTLDSSPSCRTLRPFPRVGGAGRVGEFRKPGDRAAHVVSHLSEVRNIKGTSTLSVATVTRDSVGNPTSVATQSGTTTNAYDAPDRITEACFVTSCSGSGDPYVRYTYDGIGNRKTEVHASGTTTFNYNAADQLTSRTGLGGTVNYTYDLNGNQTGAGPWTFAYNLANQMTSALNGGSKLVYTYDGYGSRMWGLTEWRTPVTRFRSVESGSPGN